MRGKEKKYECVNCQVAGGEEKGKVRGYGSIFLEYYVFT